MNLHLREQSMVVLALAITFFVLTMVKTVQHPGSHPDSPDLGKMAMKNVALQSRSILLLAVAVIVFVLDLVKVPKQMKLVFNLLSGVALVFAGLAVLLDFFDVHHKFGTIHHLTNDKNSDNKTKRVAAIVGTVGAGVALVVGATHLLKCCA